MKITYTTGTVKSLGDVCGEELFTVELFKADGTRAYTGVVDTEWMSNFGADLKSI